ncbi:hypothetical protein PLICRDRAFT_34650 [Plicaturopsis crispa FD-325 SS-3]|nr:hypothetical protein PLICRDRAFT_34650 [Plicaturopsis crispa FD-325 SS-3]
MPVPTTVYEPSTPPFAPKPLTRGTALDQYGRFNVTTNIGTEFRDAQLSELLKDDAKVRDLAILVAERNVVFFRNQDLNIDDQKILGQKLGALSGKPAESGLHIHPITPPTSELGDQVLIVANEIVAKPVEEYIGDDVTKIHSNNIHSDVTYERYGTDYGVLKLVKVPDEGGDTLWFSGYELYDRLSPPFRAFLERLTAKHDAQFLHKVAALQGFSVRADLPRGHPENVGGDLTATHPLVRTNPVTGWKSVYISHLFTKRINEVTRDESDLLLAYLFKMQAQNHDIAVRFSWRTNDIAIWDNRSSYHSATFDTIGSRRGDRVISIGERPYFDPNSKSRREALGLRAVY